MSNIPAATAVRADLAGVTLEFQHTHRLLDPAAGGVQTWQVRVVTGGEQVGSLRATRGMYWQADHLRERLADEQSFPALVAAQLLDLDGQFTREFEDFIEMAGSVLVIDELKLPAPFGDAVVVAGVIASVIDRLTDNYFAVVIPRATAPGCTGAELLAEAGAMLSAKPFSDELQIIDNALAAPQEAAAKVRARLRSRARYASEPWDEEEGEGWDDSEEDHEVLTARTSAVLRLALQELSTEAWQEVVALGDEPLGPGADGLFGSLPPVTRCQDSTWRKQMARAFDDLAADLSSGTEVEPRCTGEEMALHLGIARAEALTKNRPRFLREHLADLPEHRRDFDWDACSDELFEDHDVLMLFDPALDGVEDSSSPVNQALGMVNLAPLDWFTPFDSDDARDPDRGYKHP